MLDRDIAIYFGVETGALNRAMKRNIKRFPVNFCFQLTDEELSRCQSGISMQTAGMKGGRTFQIRGVNLGNWLVPECYMALADVGNFETGRYTIERGLRAMHIRWRVELTGDGIHRNEIPEIPVDALREAIVNIFANDFTPDDFYTQDIHSYLRNETIAHTLYLSKGIEAFGSGLKRIYLLPYYALRGRSLRIFHERGR